MILLSKILVRILPWDPWLTRGSKNLPTSCHASQDASKRIIPGINHSHVVNEWNPCLVNKTRTSEDGAISKAPKAQNIIFEKKLEIFEKKFFVREMSHRAKKCKRGDPFGIY